MSKARNSAALIAGMLLLSACSTIGSLFGPDETIRVGEIGRSLQCGAQSADMSMQAFASADAVRAWQQTSGVELIRGDQSMQAGTYVLIQTGKRPTAGYGLVVAPEAPVYDRVVRLHATLFTPGADAMVAQVETSPCVLVRLPGPAWSGVALYDQSGKRRIQVKP
ncbi:protease complex subunit PrcB family protein [Solimonas marina]|uniref:Protease complex subunit PrcB family protein n=1 Tax=Solimonas marina TaxID=2714601 RepID=A0A970B3T6_9GAMM|nr:protease complex subunit PrcB family protein [Solimonas marina]NKF21607.1 protease complex subunit PrcB family protein [Solimonas marina]